MKKIISLILCLLLLSFTFVPAAEAVKITETFDDGSYIVEDFEGEYVDTDATESEEGFIAKIINFIKRLLEFIFGKKEEPTEVQTTSATKYAEYYDKNGTLLWTVYLTAYFSYDGLDAECTASSVYYKVYDSDWSLTSMESTESENTAKGIFTMKQHKLGVPLKTVERTLTITCDKDGKLK